MIESEALEFINERIDILKDIFSPDIIDYKKALEISAKALEKQIARKPTKDKYVLELDFCPECGTEVTYCNYCPHCGQKIDWNK